MAAKRISQYCLNNVSNLPIDGLKAKLLNQAYNEESLHKADKNKIMLFNFSINKPIYFQKFYYYMFHYL